MDIILINWIGIMMVLILLYILVILFIKFGIDPDKQRKRILLKLDKLPLNEPKKEVPGEFERLLERIDRRVPQKLSDPVPKHTKSDIIGFCQMCGAGRTVDAHFCHFCGSKFDLNDINELISLHETWGLQKHD